MTSLAVARSTVHTFGAAGECQIRRELTLPRIVPGFPVTSGRVYRNRFFPFGITSASPTVTPRRLPIFANLYV